MVKLAYHCSMEQFSPKELLNLAIKAEQAGFKHLSCSDHFAPWSNSQGHSANSWCWMAAVLATTKMSCGTVCTTGYRYNTAVVAQMVATLGQMFPERFWLALGSGEYLNEQFAISPWPSKEVRNQLLHENNEIIQQLLNGKQVSSSADNVKIETAKLYTLPEKNVPIYGAALSPETASCLEHFDGLITTGSLEDVKEIVKEYRKHSSEKKLILKLDVSYANTRDEAINLGWQQWRYTQIEQTLLAELRYPEQFEEEAKHVKKEEFAEKILISHSFSQLQDAVEEFAKLGFDQINLHNVNKEQEAFIDVAAKLIKAIDKM